MNDLFCIKGTQLKDIITDSLNNKYVFRNSYVSVSHSGFFLVNWYDKSKHILDRYKFIPDNH